MIVATRIDL